MNFGEPLKSIMICYIRICAKGNEKEQWVGSKDLFESGSVNWVMKEQDDFGKDIFSVNINL